MNQLNKILQYSFNLSLDLSTKRQEIFNIWKIYRMDQNRIQLFIDKLNLNKDFKDFIIHHDIIKQLFENVCNSLNPWNKTQQEFKNQITQFGEQIKKIVKFQSGIISEEKLNNSFQVQKIEGSRLLVKITCNPQKFNKDYQFRFQGSQFIIKQYLEKFTKKFINSSQIKVKSPSKTLRIFNSQKIYTQDKYTGAYAFDPFFNAVKFQIQKIDQTLFKSNFMVINPNQINISFVENKENNFWMDELNFSSNDSIQKFVKYICQKQNGDQNVYTSILGFLRSHNIRTIGDILKFENIKDIAVQIKIKKWACEFEIQIKRIKKTQIKSSFQKYKGKQDYISCLKQGLSHKVLRYLYMKINHDNPGGGLTELKQNIPYLNFQVVQKAIQLVQKKLIMKQLFKKIRQQFHKFCIIPKQQEIQFSIPCGMLFYGPPGTGKTRLTEDLPQLMGFHLVANGLSSSNFMKQLVGQAKGTVQSYLIRPHSSSHLICSLAIDEFEPLVEKRGGQKKENKSAETISKFLSMLGGNEEVTNITCFASTNYKNKIDEAIIRRYTPSFYVGLPGRNERKQIISHYFKKLKQQTVNFLVNVTPNFSGNALRKICEEIYNKEYYNNRHGRNNYQLDQIDLLKALNEVARQLNIKLGDKTYQQIYMSLNQIRRVDLEFLKYTRYQTVLFTLEKFKTNMFFGLVEEQFVQNRINPIFQFCRIPIKLQSLTTDKITEWFGLLFNQIEVSDNIQLKNKILLNSNQSQPTLILFFIKQLDNFQETLKTIENNRNRNLHFCLYSQRQDLESLIVKNWQLFLFSQKKYQRPIHRMYQQIQYTGKVFIDLSLQYPNKMEIQRHLKSSSRSIVQKRPFLSQRKLKKINDVIPEIVEFLMERNLDFLRVINNSYFSSKGVYDEKDILQSLQQTTEQMNWYKKSAMVLVLDDFLMVNISQSHSSAGKSDSYSINRSQMYLTLLNIIKNFSSVNIQQQRWVIIVTLDEKLTEMVKKAIQWPLSAQELKRNYESQQEKLREEQRKKPLTCLYCSQLYTIQENEKQKACKIHYGQFVDLSIDNFGKMQKNLNLNQARHEQRLFNLGKQSEQRKYMYTCCWAYIGEGQPCQSFHHFSGQPKQKDELSIKKIQTLTIRESQSINLKNQGFFKLRKQLNGSNQHH